MFIEEKKRFIDKQIHSLSQINELHKRLKDIDDSFAKLYPITIVNDDVFFVFDLNETANLQWKVVHKVWKDRLNDKRDLGFLW